MRFHRTLVEEIVKDEVPGRSFPPPWIVVETTEGFRIEDASGYAVAWTYFSAETDPPVGSMTRAEAHRMAKALAMVPEMRTIIRSLQDGLAEQDGLTEQDDLAEAKAGGPDA